MQSYEEIFGERGNLYNNAGKLCATARQIERDLLLDLLDLEPDLEVCDAPAGGGYLAEGLDEKTQGHSRVVCVEPSEKFAQGIDPKFQTLIAPLDCIPLGTCSMDRVASLAGTHHLTNKLAFFNEAFRLLKPGGRFAVADVRKGSPAGNFLNDAVHRLSDTGHQGIFLREGELSSLLSAAGFVKTREDYRQYEWLFPDFKTLVTYCHLLFGMTKAGLTQVEAEIKKYFTVKSTSNSAQLPWSLLYAVGTKPQ